MDDKQFTELKDFIGDRIDASVKEQFKQTNAKIAELLDAVRAGFDQLDDDRKDLGKIKIDHANILQFFKELLDIFPRQTEKITDAMQRVANSAISDATEAVKEETAPAVRKALDSYASDTTEAKKAQKKRFWKKIFKKKEK